MKDSESKKSRIKEQTAAFGKDLMRNYTNTVNDEGKSKKILIISAVILLALVLGWWLFGNKSDEDVQDPSVTEVTYEDEEYDGSDDVTTNVYTNHDEKLVGVWGPESYDLKDYEENSWVAYKFDANGSVLMAMGEQGNTMLEAGEWASDNKGTIYVTWKNKDGSDFYSDHMTYSFDNDGKVLILDDNDYFPVPDDCLVIFS